MGKILSYMAIVAVLAAGAACSAVEETDGGGVVSVSTSENAVSVTSSGATVNAVIFGDAASVTDRGVFWSTEAGFAPETAERVSSETLSGSAFSVTLTGLQPETVYYVKAFAETAGGMTAGEEISFTTLAEVQAVLPGIRTPEVSDISPESATVSSAVEVTEAAGVSERGICYSTEPEPTIDDIRVADTESGFGEFSIALENLTDRMTYYVRAYAVSAAGVAYSDEVSFMARFVPKAPVVAFVSEKAENIDFTTATVTIRIVDNGGEVPSEYGVAYGTDPENMNQVYNETSNLIDEEGNAVIDIAGLEENTTYYIKARALNSSGEGFSENVLHFHTAIDGGDGLKYYVMEPISVTVDGVAVELEFLDRNLGAKRVAESKDDYEAYGWMFQWGRRADGHQKVTWTDASTGTFELEAAANSEAPEDRTTEDGSPVYYASGESDWVLDPNKATAEDTRLNWYWGAKEEDPLYSTGGTNNPCPEGFRVPKAIEWTAITNLATNKDMIFDLLKVPSAGYVVITTSKITFSKMTSAAYLWSADSGTGKGVTNNQDENFAGYVMFTTNKAVRGMQKAYAMPVRCVKIYEN